MGNLTHRRRSHEKQHSGAASAPFRGVGLQMYNNSSQMPTFAGRKKGENAVAPKEGFLRGEAVSRVEKSR